MKPWRTPILLALAIFDIAAIAILGYLILSRSRSTPLPAATLSPCAQIILSALEPSLSPALAWDEKQLTLVMHVFYAAPTPPESSAQLLWHALEGIQRAAMLGCTLPPDLVLIVQAHGRAAILGHVAHLHGADVSAWAAGELSEAALIARSAYWHRTETAGDLVR